MGQPLAERFQVDRETVADILGLFHSPIELMVHGIWDSRAGILAAKMAKESQGNKVLCLAGWPSHDL